MKNHKNWIALLLVLVLLLSLMACGSSDTETEETEAEETEEAVEEAEEETEAEETEEETEETEEQSEEAEEASDDSDAGDTGLLSDVLDGMDPVSLPLTEEEVTISVWYASPGVVSTQEDFGNDNYAYAALQERTGITIEFVMGNFETQDDQFNLMVAAGNYPDVINGGATMYTSGPDAAIEEEIFVNLLDYLEEYAPHYYALITSDEELLADVSTPEGNIVGFYSLYDEEKYGLGDKGYLIRQDWLDELGMEKPVTYDDLYEILVAFRDEMGADSAFVLPTSGMCDFAMAGFGIGQGFYVDDGEIHFGMLETEFKEYLELMNQWYEEGLIYQDYYSYEDSLHFNDSSMIGAGDVGVFYNETAKMTSFAEYSEDEDFLLSGIAPLVQEEGGTAYVTEFTPSYADSARWTITTNCENVELVVQLCDYLYTEEGILLCNYGVEDITYEINEDGDPEFTDLITDNPDGYALRDALALYTMDGIGTVYDPLRSAPTYTAEQLSSWDDWTNTNIDYSHALPSQDLLNSEENYEYSSIYSDIETFTEEAITKYIIGDLDFDTYETDFVEVLESMGIQDCIDLYQQAYDRYMSD